MQRGETTPTRLVLEGMDDNIIFTFAGGKVTEIWRGKKDEGGD